MTAEAPAVWRELGRSGAIERCSGPDSARALGELLTDLDSRYPVGVVLSVCVQIASVIPLLRTLAPGDGGAADVFDAALSGKAMVALAATDEAAAGSDLMDLGTRIRQETGGPRLDGGKRWITNALWADHLLVLARSRETRHFTSFAWVLLPAGRAVVRPGAEALFTGAGIGDIDFTDVRLDANHVVGRPGRAMAEFVRAMAGERLAGGLWARALCRRVLRQTYRRLRERPGGTGVLWDNAAVRDRFARCLVASSALDAEVAAASAGPLRPASAMLLKVRCADTVELVLSGCVDLLGAESFQDGGLAWLRAETAMFGIAGGASGALLQGIAQHADDLLTEVVT
ncbi:acyl-CoA dehydrogenase family protein [Amycolatopsis alba]|uniref:Acyl-[acyl-carrier-protein] dehydrogenase MbtN n=1 Tax=Amycolatopsis alba DSM 44262 TaxID=1125972 RepID=A0A229RSU6_AMYAL|nr:acyl-CoA dehydrogenase family protein [Amycolatopsis alba]OXM49732.1 acyl-CoA dehydrogenase [Amycolatopsis alba DSM 44262]